MAVTLIYRIDGSNAYVSGYSNLGDGAVVIPADDGAGHNVVGIDDYAFYQDTNITSLDMSGATNLLTIGEVAFSECAGLTGSLVIPNSVTSIGYGAFANCSGFDGTLTIGSSVTSIGDGAFVLCSSFTDGAIFRGNAPTSIGSGIFTDSSITTGYYYFYRSGWSSSMFGITMLEADPFVAKTITEFT